VVLAAKLVHQWYSEFAVMFKLWQFGGVNDVTDIAGNHDIGCQEKKPILPVLAKPVSSPHRHTIPRH